MKYLIILMLVLVSCKPDKSSQSDKSTDIDTIVREREAPPKIIAPAKTYSNARFQSVTVTKMGAHQYQVSGKAQIFEANLNWVVEDGHNELNKGYATADAGAPEWGNFTFIVDVEKERTNSTLTLILFESSAEDGSRQHELPLPLN